MDPRRRRVAALALLVLPALGSGPPNPPASGQGQAREPQQIELHVGIPKRAYIRQPLSELVKNYPSAVVAPFSGQQDASVVKIADAGISCIAAGTPGALKIASIGFNLDGIFEGVAEGDFRTSKGIGKGSTVNDLLEAYGEPLEVLGEKQSAMDRKVPLDDPTVPKMYQYASEDKTVRSFFMVQDHQVKRVVINDLGPLADHVMKRPPKKS